MDMDKHTINRCRAYGEKFLPGGVRETDFFEAFQDRHRRADKGCEAFTAESTGKGPELCEVRQKSLVIIPRTDTVTVPVFSNNVDGADSPEGEDTLTAPVAENKGCVWTTVPRKTHTLRQQLTTLLLPCRLVLVSHLPRHRSSFRHRHPLDS